MSIDMSKTNKLLKDITKKTRELDYYTYCRSHRKDARVEMAKKFRDEAEKAEADRKLNIEDPIEDYCDPVDRGNK